MRYLVFACLLGLLPASALAGDGIIFGSNSSLPAYDKDLIRRPVPGALKGVPPEPRIARSVDRPGVGLDVYQPGFYGAANVPQSQYTSMARAAAVRHGIPVELFLKLVTQESNWNPRARSHKGAMGLAQLMPATARALGVDPNDPRQNLEGGARYLSRQYAKFRSWRLALAAYNAGPAAVEKYGGVPPFKETQNYVRIILGR